MPEGVGATAEEVGDQGNRLQRMAAEHGEAVGRYATALLDTPLPWTKMRQVYRLLGLVKKWGAGRVEEACQRALDAEAVDVNLISRMPTCPNGVKPPTRWAVTDPGSRTETASRPSSSGWSPGAPGTWLAG